MSFKTCYNPYPLYTKNIISSKGNYDVIFGIITNFEWTVDGNKFRCKTEITSKDRIYAGLIVDSSAVDTSSTDEKERAKDTPLNSLVQFVDKSLDQFRNVLSTLPAAIPELKDFCAYVKKAHPVNYNEYLRSEEHTSELQSLRHLVCRLLLEKK